MRFPVTDDTLAQLVGEQVEEQIANGGEFTAYDITRTLRQAQPYLDIPHATVREWVHRYMQNVLSEGFYIASQAMFGSQTAIVYQPAYVPVIPSLPVSLN